MCVYVCAHGPFGSVCYQVVKASVLADCVDCAGNVLWREDTHVVQYGIRKSAHVFLYMCMYVFLYMCMYVYLYMCMYVFLYMCMYVFLYMCMYVFLYMCMDIIFVYV